MGGGTCVSQAKFVLKGFFPFPFIPQRNCRAFPYRSTFGGFPLLLLPENFLGFPCHVRGLGSEKKKGTNCVAIYSKLWDFRFCTLVVLQKVKKAFSQCFQAFPPALIAASIYPEKRDGGLFSICRIDVRPVVSAPPPPPTQPQGQKGENRGMSRGEAKIQ